MNESKWEIRHWKLEDRLEDGYWKLVFQISIFQFPIQSPSTNAQLPSLIPNALQKTHFENLNTGLSTRGGDALSAVPRPSRWVLFTPKEYQVLSWASMPAKLKRLIPKVGVGKPLFFPGGVPMLLRAAMFSFIILMTLFAPSVLAQSLCVDKSPCAWERHNLELARRDPDSVSAKRASLQELEGALLQCVCRESWKGNFEPKVPGDPYDNDKVISFETAAMLVELGQSLDASLLPYLHACNSEFAPALERATFTVTIGTDGSVSDVTFIHSPTIATKPAQCMVEILKTRKYLPSNTVRGFEWTFMPMPAKCQSGIS